MEAWTEKGVLTLVSITVRENKLKLREDVEAFNFF